MRICNLDRGTPLISVRYPASFNDFAVHSDFEAYRQRLVSSRDTFASVYDLVKDKVEASLK